MKWQNLWIYALCPVFIIQFLPMSFQREEFLVTVKTAVITFFLLLLLWPGLMFWKEKNSNRILSICNSLLKFNYLLWNIHETSDTVTNFKLLNVTSWWDLVWKNSLFHAAKSCTPQCLSKVCFHLPQWAEKPHTTISLPSIFLCPKILPILPPFH